MPKVVTAIIQEKSRFGFCIAVTRVVSEVVEAPRFAILNALLYPHIAIRIYKRITTCCFDDAKIYLWQYPV